MWTVERLLDAPLSTNPVITRPLRWLHIDMYIYFFCMEIPVHLHLYTCWIGDIPTLLMWRSKCPAENILRHPFSLKPLVLFGVCWLKGLQRHLNQWFNDMFWWNPGKWHWPTDLLLTDWFSWFLFAKTGQPWLFHTFDCWLCWPTEPSIRPNYMKPLWDRSSTWHRSIIKSGLCEVSPGKGSKSQRAPCCCFPNWKSSEFPNHFHMGWIISAIHHG